MSQVLEVRARIVLLRRDEGGRRSPIASGYRPAFYIENKQSDGAIYLADQEWLRPGQECEARIKLLHPEAFGDSLKADAGFEFKEGLQVVGRGTVLEILN